MKIWKPTPIDLVSNHRPRKCFCIGPQDDEKLCPCDLADKKKKDRLEGEDEAQ